jgi:hypothetical protein
MISAADRMHDLAKKKSVILMFVTALPDYGTRHPLTVVHLCINVPVMLSCVPVRAEAFKIVSP